MPLDRADVESALPNKGFRVRSGDHTFFHLFVGDVQQPIFTKVSHGTKYKTLSNDLVLKMARQTRLTKQEFERLISCTISGEAYINLLLSRGHIAATKAAAAPPAPKAPPTRRGRKRR